MAETTLGCLVEVLKKYPEGKAELHTVEIDLFVMGAVGLGVDPVDIIIEATKKGIVSFDPENQIVVLVKR